MLNKILFVVCFFCFLVIYYLHNDNIYQRQQKAVYNANNQLLLKKIDEVYDAKMETDKRIKELQEEAKKDKDVFDWHYPIGDTNVIRKLQAN